MQDKGTPETPGTDPVARKIIDPIKIDTDLLRISVNVTKLL